MKYKTLMPNNLDSFLSVEMVQKVRIDDLVSQAKKGLKQAILQACLNSFNQEIELTTSQTRFGGKRLWFRCPECIKRVGVLYRQDEVSSMKCRMCLGLKYLKQKVRI
jgi:hypothetical protein